MKSRIFSYVFALGSTVLLLTACGGGGTGSGTAHDSTACISCHEGTLTPGTGKPVVAEWKLSTHNTANAAGCADCHDDGNMHPASCTKCHGIGSLSMDPTNNPDRDGKCAKCHDKVNPRLAAGLSDGYTTAIPVPGMAENTTTRFVHFSTGKRTSYVSSNYRQNCRKCHNPHDTAFGRDQRKQWAESGHGNTRGLARTTLDAKSRGSRIPLDQNVGNGNYCVRCHTSTGFINFVAGDQFTDVNALPDIGADGLPDPNGLRTNHPEYSTSRTTGLISGPSGVVAYKDTSREATNCDVCHLDSRGSDTSSYSGTLRKVAYTTGVKIYYPYSSIGYKNVTPVLFDTLKSSNLCLTCHSGRATGKTIIEPGLIASVVANKRPSAPSVHDFAGGAVLQGDKTAFLFYTSPLKYKTAPAHRTIDTEGNGPCISCHMPRVAASQGGTMHSHLYRPVSWTNDDINADITDIVSNATVCSRCHAGASALTPTVMNDLRAGFRLSLLLLNTMTVASSNWIGPNTKFTPSVTYGTAAVPQLGGMPAAVYTMGASYNYGFLFNEPSSYNHSPILARQLIYDSIDWLANGPAGFGSATSPATVYAAIKSRPLGAGLTWSKADPIQGAILGSAPSKIYDTFTTEADRDKAFNWLCKDYVSGSNLCNRW